MFNVASPRRHPELLPVLESLSGRLPMAAMLRLNAEVDLQRRSPEQVIRQWRQANLSR